MHNKRGSDLTSALDIEPCLLLISIFICEICQSRSEPQVSGWVSGLGARILFFL